MSQNSSKSKFTLRRAIVLGVVVPAWVFVSFILAQLLVAVVAQGLQALGVSFASVNEAVFNSVLGAIVYAITLTLVIGGPWWLQKRRTSLEDLGLQRGPDLIDFAWVPAGVLVYVVLTAVVAALSLVLLPFIDHSQVQQTGFSGISTQSEYILAFLSLVVIAPVAEEVLFRGYLMGKLRKSMPVWAAIIITSLLFALVHFQWNVALDTFALSIVLCLLRLVTKSLWAPILLHAMKNGLAFYLLFINPSLISTIGG